MISLHALWYKVLHASRVVEWRGFLRAANSPSSPRRAASKGLVLARRSSRKGVLFIDMFCYCAVRGAPPARLAKLGRAHNSPPAALAKPTFAPPESSRLALGVTTARGGLSACNRWCLRACFRAAGLFEARSKGRANSDAFFSDMARQRCDNADCKVQKAKGRSIGQECILPYYSGANITDDKPVFSIVSG